MATDPKDLTARKITFFSAARENTGRALCDSGDYYGREYDRPAVTPEVPELVWNPDCSATISTPHYLDQGWEIDRTLQARFEKFAERKANVNLDWFEASAKFCKEILKLNSRIADNVYNRENDLSQVFVYNVYEDGDSGDAIYTHDSTVTVFHLHCGCDVRGGYGRPLFTRSKGEYSCPVDLCAEYGAEPLRITKKTKWDKFQALDEKWRTGYSAYPYGMLRDDVDVWHESTRTRDSVVVTLKTGEKIRVRAFIPTIS